jgi:hypothetical protein
MAWYFHYFFFISYSEKYTNKSQINIHVIYASRVKVNLDATNASNDGL